MIFLFIWDIVIFFVLWKQILSLGVIEQITLSLIFVIAHVGVIIWFIRVYFHEPILILEKSIQQFLVGTKWENNDLPLTQNPHLNFILKFFWQTLNTLKHIKSEFMYGKEIKSEVELGREIQWKMLSKKILDVPSFDIIIKSKPAREIGGDSYDIINHEDNYYIYVGDATGHGVGAGFIMMMVNSLVSGFTKVYRKGHTILSKTNEILKPRVKANLLMTMLMLRWNEANGRLFMTWAGHEYLIIYKHKQNKCFQIKSGGVALGMVKDISNILQEREIKFEKNDIIVLYSDGITEAINNSEKNGDEQMYGEERLINAVMKTPFLPNQKIKTAQSVFNNITIELSQFMWYKHVQLDDITLGVIHYKWKESEIENDVPDKIPDEMITEWKW